MSSRLCYRSKIIVEEVICTASLSELVHDGMQLELGY